MEQNKMMLNGQDVNNTSAYLQINLADDNAEVRGFGQPITRDRAKQMATDYFAMCEAGARLLDEIETNDLYEPLRNMDEFAVLKQLIDPSTQTVSGVFGKEIILQILAMRGCEGIRYVIGHDGSKNTIILIGVQESGVSDDGLRATSSPVKLTSQIRTVLGVNDKPIDGEVHKESLTITGVNEILKNKAELFKNPTDVIFGEY